MVQADGTGRKRRGGKAGQRESPGTRQEPEASETHTDHKARKIQSLGEDSETGIQRSGNSGKHEEEINHPDKELGEEQLGLFGAECRQELQTVA